MSFEKLIRIPEDRIGVLIGKSGKIKLEIEKTCSVKLDIDSKNGEVKVFSDVVDEKFQTFKALEVVTAIGRGFSPQKAMRLLKGENTLHVINLREFGGKTPEQIERIKGRIIGDGGKARVNLENLSNADITVYGKTVSVIGESTQLKLAIDAIESLLSGSMHGYVYKKIEAGRRQEKFARLQLWENQDVF
jgi:ribosomal RNA assembly protein